MNTRTCVCVHECIWHEINWNNMNVCRSKYLYDVYHCISTLLATTRPRLSPARSPPIDCALRNPEGSVGSEGKAPQWRPKRVVRKNDQGNIVGISIFRYIYIYNISIYIYIIYILTTKLWYYMVWIWGVSPEKGDRKRGNPKFWRFPKMGVITNRPSH